MPFPRSGAGRRRASKPAMVATFHVVRGGGSGAYRCATHREPLKRRGPMQSIGPHAFRAGKVQTLIT